jgi:hypothetical protein
MATHRTRRNSAHAAATAVSSARTDIDGIVRLTYEAAKQLVHAFDLLEKEGVAPAGSMTKLYAKMARLIDTVEDAQQVAYAAEDDVYAVLGEASPR